MPAHVRGKRPLMPRSRRRSRSRSPVRDVFRQDFEAPRERFNYEEDLRTVARPLSVELNTSCSAHGQAIWIVPDLMSRMAMWGGWLYGPEHLYLCSCMDATWEVLSASGTDVGSSCQADCIRPEKACQHSLAAASILGASDPPSSHPPAPPSNSFTSAALSSSLGPQAMAERSFWLWTVGRIHLTSFPLWA